jgi:hypothetical protein
MSSTAQISFRKIAACALDHSEVIVAQWLPDGIRQGAEWVARNPKRNDRRLGSFKINLLTGVWADFATDVRGGDLISLAAYLGTLDQAEAARQVACMLGINPHD